MTKGKTLNMTWQNSKDKDNRADGPINQIPWCAVSLAKKGHNLTQNVTTSQATQILTESFGATWP